MKDLKYWNAQAVNAREGVVAAKLGLRGPLTADQIAAARSHLYQMVKAVCFARSKVALREVEMFTKC